tara:strand:- start:15341 stop:15682 length:342 start_codon:yes stop_codon:yes gene_type:complete
MLDANAIRLKACRRRSALDQAELAQLMGASFHTISRFECARTTPDTPILLSYDLIFDTPARQLLPTTRIALKRQILARATRTLKRLERAPHRHSCAKVEFVRSLCQRLREHAP